MLPDRRPHRPRRSVAIGLALGLAACGAPPEADFAPSERARSAPPPRLAETANFAAALARAGPDAERIETEAAALAARAEALGARAEALSGPVIDPAARARLAPAGGRRKPAQAAAATIRPGGSGQRRWQRAFQE